MVFTRGILNLLQCFVTVLIMSVMKIHLYSYWYTYIVPYPMHSDSSKKTPKQTNNHQTQTRSAFYARPISAMFKLSEKTL